MTKLDNDRVVELLCAIGEVRAKDFRKAYKKYLKKPDEENLAELRYCEHKLRKFPTLLTETHLKKLKKQVRDELDKKRKR